MEGTPKHLFTTAELSASFALFSSKPFLFVLGTSVVLLKKHLKYRPQEIASSYSLGPTRPTM